MENEQEQQKSESQIINVKKEVLTNNNFRKVIWTADHLQATVMCIPPGGEIGLEIHDDTDQFLQIVSGVAAVFLGKTKKDIKFVGNANADCSIAISANTWHNLINEQNIPLKLYSIYAPPHHPIGTIHKTKFDSDLSEY